MIAPTLLIGLGGTGSKVIQRVCRLVEQHVQPELRKRIAYAVFDTDVNELREIKEQNPLIQTIQTSTKLSVGEYMNLDTHARDTWFPVNGILNSKTLTEGAGQVRAISRLAFETALRAGQIEPLHRALESLYKVEEDHTSQSLRIVIVSSLAGGTGSGLILPVALYLRNYLKTKFQQCSNITRGFFILPEVFYKVVKGQSERNNLKCNAYATVRELDAFIMKGDQLLPEKFDDTVKYEFPRVGANKDEFEEYNIRPYDFCFLFDAQNTESKQLNNFNQYLDHAASCIYSQSIGPTNKRSNSSEDNVIRELCAARGRNRYAGAGSSLLVYPFEDIKKYMAINWAKKNISDNWMIYDDRYDLERKKAEKMREKGITYKIQGKGEHYISSIKSDESSGKEFAKFIVQQCTVFDEEGLPIGEWFRKYVAGLDEYVQKEIDKQGKLNELYEEAQKAIDTPDMDNLNASLQSAWQEMEKYRRRIDSTYMDFSRTMAYTLFEMADKVNPKMLLKHQLETYLFADNQFIHPNAIRYFLYRLEDILKTRLATLQGTVADHVKFFNDFLTDDETFDDKGTAEVERITDLDRRKNAFMNKFGKMSADQERMKGAIAGYLEEVHEYRSDVVKAQIYEAALSYVHSLNDSFEKFYKMLRFKFEEIDREIKNIENKYNYTDGMTTRYVCASADCLHKLLEKYTYLNGGLSIDSELSIVIFESIRKFALQSGKELDSNRFFNDIFDVNIVDYFKSEVMEDYASELDVDVIKALAREITLKDGEFDQKKINERIKKTLEAARELATPFLECPMGEQREPIRACTFSPELIKDNHPYYQLIREELMDNGGTADSDIQKNMIMYYQAIYGLQAKDLNKFSAPGVGNSNGGDYFKTYYEVVSRIMPKTDETPVITPHIDKNWHIITNIPDLNDRFQMEQEARIYRAFMLSLVYRLVNYSKTSSTRSLYKLSLKGRKASEFVVSNKTPCDRFYEVLDALTINPVIVNDILKDVEARYEREINRPGALKFANSEMKRGIDTLALREFETKNKLTFNLIDIPANSHGTDYDVVREVVDADQNEVLERKRTTLFDMICLIKYSTPANIFKKDVGPDMMRVMLDETYQYMKKMTPEDKLDEEFANFVLQQFDTFRQNNMDFFLDQDNYIEYINDLCIICSEKLGAIDMNDESDQIDKNWRICQRLYENKGTVRKTPDKSSVKSETVSSTDIDSNQEIFGGDPSTSQQTVAAPTVAEISQALDVFKRINSSGTLSRDEILKALGLDV